VSELEIEQGAPDFAYHLGELQAEGVALSRIAAEVGTPFYCYSSATLERNYRDFATAFADRDCGIFYSVKANSNLAVIRTLARLGAGADVVSEGELRRALAAGLPAGKIIFSGVGKSEAELRFAVERGVFQVNVESEPELRLLSSVATSLGKRAPVALRVNPDVDARTHAKIATGKKENKFGIDLAQAPAILRLAATLSGIAPVGLAVHIGSQLTELTPFELAFARVGELIRSARRDGIAIGRLDLGGGLGNRYRHETVPSIEDYARLVKRVTDGLEVALAIEPGRRIVANAGILAARILYVKEGAARRFLVVDAAMNDLIRPSLYGAWHEIIPILAPAAGAARRPIDVVGPVCESGDSFAEQRLLPPLAAGDLVALLSAGAYGAVMSSSYNTRLMVPEVLVRGDAFAVIRPRPGYDELLSQDKVPEWLAWR
jgi:diaminopimelate decarboxylase